MLVDDVVFLFDMDGTLTPARLPMESDFAIDFKRLITGRRFYLVTGSDLEKIEEQIPEDILNEASGIYSSMGNEFYVSGKLVYKNEFTPPAALIKSLEEYRSITKYPHELYPNYIERRAGMINFCIVGRNCPKEARGQYKEWDDIAKERIRIAEDLSKKFCEIDFVIGGSISIDIVPKGFSKAQVARQLRKLHLTEKIVFFGDMIKDGGNDYDLAEALVASGDSEIVPVMEPADVLKHLTYTNYDAVRCDVCSKLA